jgi:diguanylate cyclase (GGDEF)-like protein
MLRERAEAEIRRLAMFDPLTSLYNRRAFMDLAEREMARARRNLAPLAVLMLDLDNFKRVNDDFGHQAGDRVLREFAAAASRCLRAEDVFGRYGGEEFCAVLPGAAPGQAIAVAERIRLAAAEQPLGGLPRPTTISIGVAYCEPGKSFALDSAISRADEALYQAKKFGRNRVLMLPLSPRNEATGARRLALAR